MKLLTKEIEKTLPALYAGEDTPLHEKVAYLKVFDPTGRLTYYATEYDPTEKLFFGYMVSPLGEDCDEWGYSSLDEFEALKGRFGLGLERDLYFRPQKIGEIFPAMIPGDLRASFQPHQAPPVSEAERVAAVFADHDAALKKIRPTVGDVLAHKEASISGIVADEISRGAAPSIATGAVIADLIEEESCAEHLRHIRERHERKLAADEDLLVNGTPISIEPVHSKKGE